MARYGPAESALREGTVFLSAHEEKLLRFLWRLAWERGSCWPSLETLAEHMGKSTRQIRAYLDALENLGIIDKRQPGQGKTNRYYLADWSRPDRWKEFGALAREESADQLPDRKPISGLDRKPISGLDRKPISGLDRKPISGLDRKPISGPIKELASKDVASSSIAREPAAAAKKWTSEEKAARELIALGVPTALADQNAATDAEMALAIAAFARWRLTPPRGYNRIANRAGFVVALLRDPPSAGFERDGGVIKYPDGFAPPGDFAKAVADRRARDLRERQTEADAFYADFNPKFEALEPAERAAIEAAVAAAELGLEHDRASAEFRWACLRHLRDQIRRQQWRPLIDRKGQP